MGTRPPRCLAQHRGEAQVCAGDSGGSGWRTARHEAVVQVVVGFSFQPNRRNMGKQGE